MIAKLPFAGFYNSWHDEGLDNAMARIFSDRKTGCHVHEVLQGIAHFGCDWSEVHREYAKAYAEAFLEKFAIAGTFESMASPREYNFTTDRIFATIEPAELARIRTLTHDDALEAVAREWFTSRSGFLSSYSNDWHDWGPVETWDHNQAGALLQAYANQETGEDFDQDHETRLTEDFDGNGHLENWIIGAFDAKAKQALRVHDYLQDRAER